MCIRWYFIYCHHVVSSQQQHPKGNCLGLCLRTQWDPSSVHPTRPAWVHHCFSPHQSINFHLTHQKLKSKVNFKRLTNKSILLLLFFYTKSSDIMESVHPQSQTHFQEFCSCLWVGAEVPVNMSRFHLGMSAVEGACQCEAWLHVNIAITFNEQKAFACQSCMRSVRVTSWRPGRRGPHHSSRCWSETFSRTPETSISEDNHTARSSLHKSSFQVKAMDTIFFSRQHKVWLRMNH